MRGYTAAIDQVVIHAAMSPLRPTRLFTALFIIGLADSTEMECVGSCNQLHAGGQSCVPISTAPDLKYCADQDPASWKVILLQFQETTDYTIMFAFAIVDQNCNPPTSISSASLMQQKQVIVKENGAEASASETFSGMVDSKIAIKIKYLLLMDQSNSVLSQESTDFFAWATALIDAANSSQTQKVQASVAIAGFDGREQIILHADFTSDFASLKVSLNEKLNRETLMGDPNRDVSTNLNGALDQAITILSKSDDALATAVPVLVIFTDGADKANRVKWPTVKKRAQDFPGSMYLACVPGETDSDKEYKEFQEVAGRSGKVDINSASLTGGEAGEGGEGRNEQGSTEKSTGK
eukprot:747117-Hanusia_phi.AAC.1